MKSRIILILLSYMLLTLPLSFAEDIDLSKPYPLSLLPYPGKGVLGQSDQNIIAIIENIKINSDNTSEFQNEENVCINPTNTDNAVAVWRDFREGYRRVGVGYTFDAGLTWTDALITVYPPYGRQSDPVLWVDRDGNFYLSGLDIEWDWLYSGISVYKSTDGGLSWSAPTWVVGGHYEYFEDKQWFAMDQTGSSGDGNIYCVWDRFSASQSYTGIVCATSVDNGLTFSEPVAVSAYDYDYVQWPTVTVGPTSTVYVAWYDHRTPRRISFARSYDYGVSFTPEQGIITLDSAYTTLNGSILCFPFPAMACDVYPGSDHFGNLYIIYADGESDWDIWCRRSADGGISWSDKVRVNDDPMANGCDQFHPWLSIDNDGAIHVCFLDRRDDPGNMLYNVYYTKSVDGGLTWEANQRVSTVSSDPGQAALAGLLGEYIGISVWNGEVQMVWTDIRNLNQDVYSARITPSISLEYLPGDVNMANGAWPPLVIGGDVTYLVNYFRSLPSSQACLLDGFWCSADANGDCLIIGSDVTRLVNYFRGLSDINYCPDYEPAWPTPDDLPEDAPQDWPNCE
ncbi:MAG: exo-alpha-sialidase [candidate division Zixibacteria bacterium]|nr:exo-alpha-sialidase [candidate division Zixibacteria bacterium]